MNDAVLQMDQTTRQNAALVEEAAAAAGSLQDQANHLARLVATFKVLEQSAASTPAKRLSRSPSGMAEAKPGAAPQLKHTKTEHAPGKSAPKAAALPTPQSAKAKPATSKLVPSTATRATGTGLAVGKFQTSAGTVEEWEEF